MRRSRIDIELNRWITVCRVPAPRRDVELLFDKLIHQAWGRTDWRPRVDAFETDSEIIVRVDLPGVALEDVSVAVEHGRLIIQGCRHTLVESEPHPHIHERPAGKFERRLLIEQEVDVEHISATLDNGVLTVVLPKQAGGKENPATSGETKSPSER